jgi:hypothetical protein
MPLEIPPVLSLGGEGLEWARHTALTQSLAAKRKKSLMSGTPHDGSLSATTAAADVVCGLLGSIRFTRSLSVCDSARKRSQLAASQPRPGLVAHPFTVGAADVGGFDQKKLSIVKVNGTVEGAAHGAHESSGVKSADGAWDSARVFYECVHAHFLLHAMCVCVCELLRFTAVTCFPIQL